MSVAKFLQRHICLLYFMKESNEGFPLSELGVTASKEVLLIEWDEEIDWFLVCADDVLILH